MQPRGGNIEFGKTRAARGGAGGAGGAGDGRGPDGRDEDGESPDDRPATSSRPDTIRERQRRRRDAGRSPTDLAAVLARPEGADEDADEEDEGEPAGPPPARVYVVFREAHWEDPGGGLRESDSIVGVYATEEAARRAVAALKRETGEGGDGWYQPYPVQAG